MRYDKLAITGLNRVLTLVKRFYECRSFIMSIKYNRFFIHE
jgi:hypothetical protein